MTEVESELIRPRRRLRLAAYLLVGLVVVGGVGAELVARYGLGLGDPPLFRLDPDVEYELVPSRSYRRLGTSFEVNAYSMRSADFPANKAGADELRVLVVGDSVVNGGRALDQNELATEVLRKSLSAKTHRPVTVGNASAGSWGPPNELAYIKKHGLFESDVVLLVLNSQDYGDVPGLEGIGSAWPRTKPTLAVEELIEKGLGKVMQKASGRSFGPAPKREPNAAKDGVESAEAVRTFVDIVRAHGAKIAIVQHMRYSELKGEPLPGYQKLRSVAVEMQVPVFETEPAFKKELDGGGNPYLAGDDIHPNPTGQRLVADVLERAVMDLIGDAKTSPGGR